MNWNADIEGMCYGCAEPILDGEEWMWAIPHGREYEEQYHSECQPSTFMIEEEEVTGLDDFSPS